MHPEHDLDLISGLAEGTLADPGPAEDLVATCPECAAYHRAHMTVRAAAAAEARPGLTELERARLRSSVWEQVGTAERRPSPSPWWYRLAPVAAVLVVLVGVGVSGWLDEGGDVALEAGPATTVAADDGGGGEADTELAPLSDETTEAPAATMADTTVAAAQDLAESSFTREGLGPALDEFRRRSGAEEVSIPEAFDCEAPEEVEGTLLAVEEVTVEGRSAWFAAYGDGGQAGTGVAFDRTDCEVLAVER